MSLSFGYPGASGTSTPNKDALPSKDQQSASKRMDNYHKEALNEIRKSLKTFKKDDPNEVLDPVRCVAIRIVCKCARLDMKQNHFMSSDWKSPNPHPPFVEYKACIGKEDYAQSCGV